MERGGRKVGGGGDGVIRFDSERHDHIWKFSWRTLTFDLRTWKLPPLPSELELLMEDLDSVEATPHTGVLLSHWHCCRRLYFLLFSNSQSPLWLPTNITTSLGYIIRGCFSKFHCSVFSTMFIISGNSHYLIWPTTKWLPKDGHQICLCMAAISDAVRYVQDCTMFQKLI